MRKSQVALIIGQKGNLGAKLILAAGKDFTNCTVRKEIENFLEIQVCFILLLYSILKGLNMKAFKQAVLAIYKHLKIKSSIYIFIFVF